MPAAKTTVKQKPGPKPKAKGPVKPRAVKAPVKDTIAQKKAATQEKRFAKLRQKAIEAHDVPTTAIALKNADRPLTEMQMMFVRHWAAGESILSASARAGYHDGGTYGYRLAKDPAVIKIYEREKRAYEASVQMTRKRVMEGFLDAADMAKIQADPTAMVGAWREVGKMCGYYEPVKKIIDINVNGTITQKVERLSDDDLLAIIKGEAGAEVLDVAFNEVPEESENE